MGLLPFVDRWAEGFRRLATPYALSVKLSASWTLAC